MKRLIFLLYLLFVTAFSYGQGSDGFFRNGSDYENRGGETGSSLTVHTENFNDAGLDDGIVILGALSLLYLSLRKRKAYPLLIASVMLVSCSKECVYVGNGDDVIDISFTSGGKGYVNGLGEVSFTNGDRLHMFAGIDGDGRYLGDLTGTSDGVFTGTVSKWNMDERLSFWYTGVNSVGSDGTIFIDFSDQTVSGNEDNLEKLSERFHIGVYRTTAPDDAETVDFTGTLHNMMSIAVFDTRSFEGNVKLTGTGNNAVLISSDGSADYRVAGVNRETDTQSGHIIINGGSEHHYTVLLPYDEETESDACISFTGNTRTGCSPLHLNIGLNQFYHMGYDGDHAIGYIVSSDEYVSEHYADFPSPAECVGDANLFTVYDKDGDVKKVVFSRGNLVYDCGRFKQHRYPWESCGVLSDDGFGVDKVFDVFGWAASGYDYGQPIYQPYACSVTGYPGDKGYGYGIPKSNYKQSFHPDVNYRRQDWGWYQFGMGVYGEYELPNGYRTYWRTMGQQEWIYLFKSRSTSSQNLIDGHTHNAVNNARYVKATVEGVCGVILFPDTYAHPSGAIQLSYINNQGNSGLSSNILTSDDLIGSDGNGGLCGAGAVFIPFLGYYDKVNQTNVGSDGCYWTCKTQSTDGAYYFNMGENVISSSSTLPRYQGLYVRLVLQVEGSVF